MNSSFEKEFNHTHEKLFSSGGSTIVLILVFLSSLIFDIFPKNVVTAFTILLILPLYYNFVFGALTNKPKFSIKKSHTFIFFLLITYVVFMVFVRPEDISSWVYSTLQYLFALIMSMVISFLYILPFNSLKKKSYRVRAIVGFLISLGVTIGIIFIVKSLPFMSIILT